MSPKFDQADITGLQEFINKNAEKVAQNGGKLTVTAILVKVCAAALKKFERFNASIDPANQRLILKRYVHIGIAADTSRGLLVPVVHNADQKSISRLAAEITDLADRARNKKLKPDGLDPEIAWVGLTEKEAADRDIAHKVVRKPE